MQNLGHTLRNRGFSGARIAGERHVKAGRTGGEIQFLADAIHEQQGGGFADTGFHRFQTDQLAVKLIQYFLDIGSLKLGFQINGTGIGRGNFFQLCFHV